VTLTPRKTRNHFSRIKEFLRAFEISDRWSLGGHCSHLGSRYRQIGFCRSIMNPRFNNLQGATSWHAICIHDTP